MLAIVVAGGVALPSPADAQPAPPLSARIALNETEPGAVLRLLAQAPVPFVVAARIELGDISEAAQLAIRLDAIEARRLPVWLVLPAPGSQTEMEAWRLALRGLLARPRSMLELLEITVDRQPAAVATFAVQLAATEARARRAGVQVGLGGPAMSEAVRRLELYTAGLSPYLDVLVVPEAAIDRDLVPWLKSVDASATLALRSDPAPGPPLSARAVVDDVLRDLGTDIIVRAFPSSRIDASALRGLIPLAGLMSDPVTELDAAAARLTLTLGQADMTAAIAHRLLYDLRTLGTYLIYWGDAAPDLLTVSLILPVEGRPGVHDLLTGAHSPVAAYTRERDTGRVEATMPLTGRPMLVDFNEGIDGAMAERAEVSAARVLSIEEIVSRHQLAQLGQDFAVRNYTALARMRQHFRPTLTDPGYDIVTENRYFVEGATVEWEERSFSVNGSKWTNDRPPFPLLQPEKVLSLPLQLKFDDGYTYRLDGTAQVDGYDCYVVRFEPVRRDSALYRGTVWIDRRSFARIRVHAVQGRLAAPVVSNEETHNYVRVATIGEQPVFLFAGLSARQIVLVAGRNLLVEKDVAFSGHAVNDPEFEEARAAARASNRIMFRETAAGLRYFVKEGNTRVVSENPTASVRAMAMGVYLDPSYAFPLPIAGINYLNFSFGGSSNTQLALLFGGVLAAGNVQRPKLGSTGLDASIDFFAIAVPSSDRLFEPGGEAKSERVLTWPMSTGLNLGWQATPFQKLILQYQLRFDVYTRDRTTQDSFRPPSSTVTNGIGAGWEYRRGGYNVTLNSTWYARSRWADWGSPQSAHARVSVAAARTYLKYSAGVSRTVFLGPLHKVYVNAAWFGGRDLDRFVQYQFGMFDDTRIHGVPSSGVRFGELAMVRGTYSLNVFEQYRLDLFLEHAWGRQDASDRDWRPIPGVGMAVNVRAPWNTILRAELGKSHLPDRYAGLGATTLQVLLLKPLR